VKIRAEVCAKEGMPNYGSIGASASIEFSVAEDELSASTLEILMADLKRAFSTCEIAVQDQLRGQRTRSLPPPDPAPARPENGRAPERGGHQADSEDDLAEYREQRPAPRNGHQDRNGSGSRDSGRSDAPRNARQLLAVARKRGDEYFEDLKRLGKSWNLSGRIVDWSDDDAVQAYGELEGKPARGGWGGGR